MRTVACSTDLEQLQGNSHLQLCNLFNDDGSAARTLSDVVTLKESVNVLEGDVVLYALCCLRHLAGVIGGKDGEGFDKVGTTVRGCLRHLRPDSVVGVDGVQSFGQYIEGVRSSEMLARKCSRPPDKADIVSPVDGHS